MRRIYLLYRSCPVLEFLSPPTFASCRPAVAHSTWRCFVEDADHSRHCLFRLQPAPLNHLGTRLDHRRGRSLSQREG